MLSRRQELWFFALAVGLHAGAIWILRATIGERIFPSTPSFPPAAALAFDITLDGEADATRDTSDGVELDAREVAARRIARIEAQPRSYEPGPEGVSPEAGDVTADGELEAEAAPEAEASSRAIDLGIGPDGWQRWVEKPKAGSPPRAERPRVRANRFQPFRAPPVSTTGGLQEGLEAHDRSLGLGPSGRVLSALHNAAHETVAPSVGTARFDVTVLSTGAVEVSLGAASGQVDAWREVAAHIANDLRAAPPKVGPPREGVRFVVELVAEETMPNGTKVTSLTSPHLDVTLPKLEITERSMEQLKEENPVVAGKDSQPSNAPAIKLDLPGVYIAERGKVCSYRLGVSVFGFVFQGGCDPSHIGAKPQRMVRTRVIEQTMF